MLVSCNTQWQIFLTVSLCYCAVLYLLVRVFLFELLQDLGHVSAGLLLVQILLIQIQTQRTIQKVDAMRVEHLSIHLNVHLVTEKMPF